MFTSSKNDVYLICRRSKTLLWKKEDIDRFFELTNEKLETDTFETKKINENINKCQLFVIRPRSRFNLSGELKLGKHDDLIYFEINGLDNFSYPQFIRFIFCGYAIGNARILKMLQQG